MKIVNESTRERCLHLYATDRRTDTYRSGSTLPYLQRLHFDRRKRKKCIGNDTIKSSKLLHSYVTFHCTWLYHHCFMYHITFFIGIIYFFSCLWCTTSPFSRSGISRPVCDPAMLLSTMKPMPRRYRAKTTKKKTSQRTPNGGTGGMVKVKSLLSCQDMARWVWFFLRVYDVMIFLFFLQTF